MKKLLTAVAKLQTGTPPASAAALASLLPVKPKAKAAEDDSGLGGAIFNMIFNS